MAKMYVAALNDIEHQNMNYFYMQVLQRTCINNAENGQYFK